MSAHSSSSTGRQWLRLVPVAAWMGVIFAFSAQETLPRPPGVGMDITSVAGHFAVYAVLAGLTWWAIGPFELSPRRQVLVAFTVAILYGVSDEWHQSFVPGRTPDFWDLVADAIGAAAGIAIAIRISPILERPRN